MKRTELKRREVLDGSAKLVLGAAAGSLVLGEPACVPGGARDVVGVVKIRNDNIGAAVDQVARKFARPTIYAWKDIRNVWGAREI